MLKSITYINTSNECESVIHNIIISYYVLINYDIVFEKK